MLKVLLAVFYACMHAAIILPTAWDYLRIRFKVANNRWLYGLTIAAANAVSVIVEPLFGAVYDKTHACKTLVLISVLCSVLGEQFDRVNGVYIYE